MWKNRAPLLLGLKEWGIDQAAQTATEQYEKLILNDQPWWELLRMLKQSKLDTGLGLTVPREFIKANPSLLDRRRIRGSDIRHPPRSSQPPNDLPNRASDPSITSAEHNHGASSTENEVNMASTNNRVPGSSLPRPSQRRENDGGQPRSLIWETSPNPSHLSKRRKMNDCSAEDPEDDTDDQELAGDNEEFYKLLTPPGSDSDGEETEPVSQRSLRCHSVVSRQLQQLEGRVEHMQPDEAHALEGFLRSIFELQGTGHMVRVIDALSAKVQVSFRTSSFIWLISTANTRIVVDSKSRKSQ